MAVTEPFEGDSLCAKGADWCKRLLLIREVVVAAVAVAVAAVDVEREVYTKFRVDWKLAAFKIVVAVVRRDTLNNSLFDVFKASMMMRMMRMGNYLSCGCGQEYLKATRIIQCSPLENNVYYKYSQYIYIIYSVYIFCGILRE